MGIRIYVCTPHLYWGQELPKLIKIMLPIFDLYVKVGVTGYLGLWLN